MPGTNRPPRERHTRFLAGAFTVAVHIAALALLLLPRGSAPKSHVEPEVRTYSGQPDRYAQAAATGSARCDPGPARGRGRAASATGDHPRDGPGHGHGQARQFRSVERIPACRRGRRGRRRRRRWRLRSGARRTAGIEARSPGALCGRGGQPLGQGHHAMGWRLGAFRRTGRQRPVGGARSRGVGGGVCPRSLPPSTDARPVAAVACRRRHTLRHRRRRLALV